MYKKTSKGEGYVVSILKDGQTVTEQGGKVLLPFESEYEIRLRNKTRKRAVADVYVDGELATKGGLVVDANSSVDLERYIKNTGHALLKGSRFKFVPVGDSRVNDKGEPENGRIEVRWYPEKEPKPYTPLPFIIEPHGCHHHYPHGTTCPWCWPPHFTFTNTGGAPFTSGGGGSQSANSLPTMDNASVDVVNCSVQDSSLLCSADAELKEANLGANVGEAGATVEGSLSHQQFSTIDIDVDKSKPTILTLFLVGQHVVTEPARKGSKQTAYCSTCGRKRGSGEQYCPTDGKRFDN